MFITVEWMCILIFVFKLMFITLILYSGLKLLLHIVIFYEVMIDYRLVPLINKFTPPTKITTNLNYIFIYGKPERSY